LVRPARAAAASGEELHRPGAGDGRLSSVHEFRSFSCLQIPMRYPSIALLLVWLCGYPLPAAALSDAPLRVLTSYIESNSRCSEQIADWNRKNGNRAISGELTRDFF